MELIDFLKKNKIKPKKFEPHIEINAKEKYICIYLEDCSHFADFINVEKEGVSSIFRANDRTQRIIGACLPLRNYNGKFKVFKR